MNSDDNLCANHSLLFAYISIHGTVYLMQGQIAPFSWLWERLLAFTLHSLQAIGRNWCSWPSDTNDTEAID